MTIGITANFTGQAGEGAFNDAAYEIIKWLVARHPKYQFFLFYSSTGAGLEAGFPSNVIVHRKPHYKHPLLQKLWYDVVLSRLLRKHKVDALLSTEGYCSGTTRVFQCLLMPGSIVQGRMLQRKRGGGFYQWLLPGFLSRAGLIIAGSHRHKAFLNGFLKTGSKNTEVIYSGINGGAGLLSAEEKTVVQHRYTGGMEYFIYEGAVETNSVLALLKAFSLFKKRQRTSWKLVLNRTEGEEEEAFKKLLRTYKYRDDVVLTSLLGNSERDRLQGAAYGAIDLRTDHCSIETALAWMALGVPYIATDDNPIQEVEPQAALFFNVEEPAVLGERLMDLYKDEALHAKLTNHGLDLARKYSWQATADTLCEMLMARIPTPTSK